MDFIVIDVETTGLSWQRDKLHGLGVCVGGLTHYYSAQNIPDDLKAALANPAIPKVGHNVRFDLKFLHAAGIQVSGDVHDTMLLAHLLDENGGVGLKELVPRYLGANRLGDKAAMDAACGLAGARNIAELSAADLDGPLQGQFFNVIGRYCEEDCLNTHDLFLLLSSKLGQDEGLTAYYMNEIVPFEKCLLDIELEGCFINEAALDKYGAELRIEQTQLEAQMHELAADKIAEIEESLYESAKAKRKTPKGKEKVLRRSNAYSTIFCFSSGPHIGRLLYEGFTFPAVRTAKGNYDTSEATLSSLKGNGRAEEFLKVFFKWRAAQKNLSTYVDGLREHIVNGKIHSNYGQTTATARTKSSAPNMQNLPRGSVVKQAFLPAKGNVYVYFDYSQVELRIAAHLSQDSTMLSWFNLGIDPHQMIATQLGVDRQVGKTINFLAIYDGKQVRLHQSLVDVGITQYTPEDCKEILKGYWKEITEYRAYLDAQLALVRKEKRLVSSTGRIRRLPDIVYGDYLDWRNRTFTGSASLINGLKAYSSEYLTHDTVFERASIRYSHAKKQAFNFPVQHLGAAIMKNSIIELRKQGYVVVTTVHDSVVVSLPVERIGEVQNIQRIAENAYKLSVPLKCDVKILNSLDEKDLFSLQKP